MTALPDRRRATLALWQVAAGAFLLSFAAVFVKLANVGPTAAGFYRMLVGGIVLLSLVFVGPKTQWGWIGLVPLVTGFAGLCPLYAALGWSTCPKTGC